MNPILAFLNALSSAGLTAVLNTLWMALAIAALMSFVLRLIPGVNAATRHVVWLAVLGLVVFMPLATLPHRPVSPVTSPMQTEKQIRTRPLSSLSSSGAKPIQALGADLPHPPLLSSPLSRVDSRPGLMPSLRIPIELHLGNWPSILLFLWMTGCTVLLGRIVHGYLRLRGLRNHARPASADLIRRFAQHLSNSRVSRSPRLLVSDEVISPLAAGFLDPVVILPGILLEEITEPELDYVLLHELAHVARRDDWTNLIGRLASALLVFHPVAAWILGRIRREREIACDDWVVAATGSAVPYAMTLGRLAEFCSARRHELLATQMADRSSSVRQRIEILLRPRFSSSPAASLSRVAFCVATGLALLSLGVRTPGWIAFAKDAPVAVRDHGAAPQSQNSAPRVTLAPKSSATQLVAKLSTADRTLSSAVPFATQADQEQDLASRMEDHAP